MKRVVLAVVLVLGIAGAGFAQQTPAKGQDGEKEHHENHKGAVAKKIKSPEERAKLFTTSLDKHLNLSETQEKEIYNIQLENAQKFDAMRKQHKTDEKHRHPAGKANAYGIDKINSVLTVEQRAAYQKMREERMKKLEEYRAKHKNGIKSDSAHNRRLETKKVK